jgi:hypothetical protein
MAAAGLCRLAVALCSQSQLLNSFALVVAAVLQVFGAVVRHVDWSIVKCLVIAGPGFAKDTFKTYLEAEAVRRDVRPLIENKASIITAQVGNEPHLFCCTSLTQQNAVP